MRYDRITRWLHAGIALGISAQLGLSLFMEAPDDKKLVTGMPLELFEAHESIGMILLIAIILHWLWSLSGHVDGGFGHLFPWFSKEHMGKVIDDSKQALKFNLPDPESSNALAGAVHGLGLLTATGLASTGAVIFFNLSETGHITELGHYFHEIHESLGPLMWAYFIAHFIVAIIHKRMGHSNVKDMFSLLK